MTTTADLLRRGLNGDPDQRAATELLINGAGGAWLNKLDGWTEYMREVGDTGRAEGLWIDWQQLREDLAADEQARASFNAWAESYAGRRAGEADYERQQAERVPPRPWHAASRGELTLLRIAVDVAPGGLLGDGITRLDSTTRTAVAQAITELVDDQHTDPASPRVG